MKKKTCQIGRVFISKNFSLLIFTLLFSMCSKDKKEWIRIKTLGIDSVYEDFIENYSSSTYADSAYFKLEAIYLNDIDIENQIINFKQLNEKFHQGNFISKSESILNNLYLKRDLFPIRQNDSLGYINKNGEIIIAPSFNYAEDFNNGFAFVKYKGKWGIINKLGEYIIQPEYEEICGFSEGLAAIKIDTVWGYADTTGNMIINPKFQDAWPFIEGLALVKQNNKWGFIDKNGEIKIDTQYDGAYCDQGMGISIIVVEGKFAVLYSDRNNITFIKKQTEWLSQEYAYLSLLRSNSWSYKRNFSTHISSTPLPDTWVDIFSEGLARCIINGSWGYIDRNGQQIIKPQFIYCSDFSNGLAIVQLNLNSKLGFINKSGEIIIKPQYEAADILFSEGLFVVMKYDKYGYIDSTGKVIINYQFDNANPFSEGLAAVELKNKWGFINKEGQIIIDTKYEKTTNFSEGYAGILLNDKWGFINKSGEVVIDFKYDRIHNFDKGIALVRINNKETYIDKYDRFVRDTL